MRKRCSLLSYPLALSCAKGRPGLNKCLFIRRCLRQKPNY
jgi:hypothetical protein